MSTCEYCDGKLKIIQVVHNNVQLVIESHTRLNSKWKTIRLFLILLGIGQLKTPMLSGRKIKMPTVDEKVDRICNALGVHLLDYQKILLSHYIDKRYTSDTVYMNTSRYYGRTLLECLRLLLSQDIKQFTIEEFDEMISKSNFTDCDGLSGYITMLNQRLRKAGIITNLITK